MKNHCLVCLLTLSTVILSRPAPAQIALTGNHYTQNFDALASGLPPGWSVMTNASATNLGSAVSFTTNATSWGSSSGQFANFASTTNNDSTPFAGGESVAIQAAATNRSVGVRLTGTVGDPGAAFVLRLQNTTGLGNFQLGLDFNMLSVQGRTNISTVDYGIGSTPAVFTPIGVYTDPGSYGTTPKTFSFGNALDNQSQDVWIRIVTLAASTGSGSRDTVGIDNFHLSYASVSPAWLDIQLHGEDAVLTWTNAAFGLQAAPAVGGIYTNLPGAVSPYTNPIANPQVYFRLKAN